MIKKTIVMSYGTRLAAVGRRYLRTKSPKTLKLKKSKSLPAAAVAIRQSIPSSSTIKGSMDSELDTVQRIMQSLPLSQQYVLQEALAKAGPKPILEAIKELETDIISKEHEEKMEKPVSAQGLETSPYSRKLAIVKFHFDFHNVATESTYVEEFWINLQELSRTKRQENDHLPIEFLCNVFECAKIQPQKYRPGCIKLVGDMLYNGTKLRMDPFNEAEYIDALCIFGQHNKGLNLWEDRRQKPDVQNLQLYWYQTGILALQKSHKLVRAESLAEEMEAKFSYISPRIILGFINAYTRSFQADKATVWYERLLKLLGNRKATDIPKSNNPSAQMHTIDSAEAINLLNAELVPCQDDLQQVLVCGLNNCLWDFSVKVLEDLRKFEICLDLETTLKIFDSSTRRLVGRDSDSALCRKIRLKKRPENAQYFSKLISGLVESHPEVLKNPDFYLTWLRGMAGMELPEDCLNLINAMHKSHVPMRNEHFQVVVSCLLKCQKLDMAYQILTEMEQSTSLVSKHESTEMPGELMYLPVSAEIYASFISYFAERSDEKNVLVILNRMEKFRIPHSSASFSALIYYYYRHKKFDSLLKLVNSVLSKNSFKIPMTNYNYRSIWLMLRDYYRQSRVQTDTVPDLRYLFKLMVYDNKFNRSINIYEYCLQTFMLSGDFVGLFAVLRYMEKVSNTRIPGNIFMTLLGMAERRSRNKKNLLLQPPEMMALSKAKEQDFPSVPWQVAVDRICQVLGVKDNSNWLIEANAVSRQFEVSP